MIKSTATTWGSSRWAEFQRCEVAHALAYEPGRFRLPLVSPFAPKRKGSGLDHLQIGSLVHAALEVVCRNQKDGTDRDWCEALVGDMTEVFEAQRLVQRYLIHWGKSWELHEDGFEVVEVETPVEIKVGGMPWSTRLDVLLRDSITGRLVVCDHKTRGSLPSAGDRALLDEYRVRPQFLGAIAATRVTLDLDYNPDFIVDVLCKTRTPAYKRLRFSASDEMLQAWVDQQVALAERYSLGANPVRNLHACMGGYRLCDWYDKCHGAETTQQSEQEE